MRSLPRAARAAAPLLVAAIGLGGVACTTAPQRAHDRVLEDAAVASRIKTALLRDPIVAGSAIGVEVVDGIVTVTGRVPSDAVAHRALEIVREAEGVRRVEDRLVREGRAPAGRSSSAGVPGASLPARGRGR